MAVPAAGILNNPTSRIDTHFFVAKRREIGYDISTTAVVINTFQFASLAPPKHQRRGSVNRTEAFDEYARALRAGQREYKELISAGKEPYPAVLDDILTDISTEATQNVGLVEIPTDQIIGTKSAGRISAFTASFLPLLDADSEFANKWVALCLANLSDEGIREPIVCYEYLGNFYVQEGNKRVSVLKHFGAARIPGNVTGSRPTTNFLIFIKPPASTPFNSSAPVITASSCPRWVRNPAKAGRSGNG